MGYERSMRSQHEPNREADLPASFPKTPSLVSFFFSQAKKKEGGGDIPSFVSSQPASQKEKVNRSILIRALQDVNKIRWNETRKTKTETRGEWHHVKAVSAHERTTTRP